MIYIKVADVENSVDFQFDNSKADGCLINDVQGFEDSVAINSVEDVASRIGAVGVNSKSGRRIVSWVARLTCDVLDKRKEMLAALRRTGYLKLVTFKTLDNIELRFEAYFDKLNAPYSSALNKPMMVQMVAPDPRFYSQTLHTETIARNSTAVVANAGTEVSNPILRVHGPFSAFTITSLNNGQTITVTETLIAGEYIDIDCLNQTIIEDDGTSRYPSATGVPDFIVLEAGNNSIQFADTGGAGTTELDVIYRDAYNGI